MTEPDPFDIALSELAVQHGQAFFCDPLEDEPPCEDCAALFQTLRRTALKPLLAALEALEGEMRTEGDTFGYAAGKFMMDRPTENEGRAWAARKWADRLAAIRTAHQEPR